MFHIFRWRRERRNENTTSSNLSTDEEHKKSHSRRLRLREYYGARPLERLFHIRRYQSPSNHDQQQVIIYHLHQSFIIIRYFFIFM